jgi:hypothetical protein
MMATAARLDPGLVALPVGAVRHIEGLRLRRERWGAALFDGRYDRVWAMDETVLAAADPASLAHGLRFAGDPFLRGGPYFLGALPPERGFSLQAPVSVSWVLNQACQSSCVYCCTNSHPRAHPGAEAAAAEALIALLARWGVLRLIVGGGEPLLHPQLDRILAAASDHGLAPVLATNGFLLDAQRARALAGEVSQFQISLDSVDPVTYAALRGRAGGPAASLAAIRAGLDAGAGVRVVTVVSARNLAQLPAIGDAVHATGATQWFLFEVQPSGRGSRVYAKLRLPLDAGVRARLAELKERWPGMAVCYWGDGADDGVAVYADPDAQLSIHDYRADTTVNFSAAGSRLDEVARAWNAVPAPLKRRTLVNFTASERAL